MIRKLIFSFVYLSFLSANSFAQNPNPPLCVPISSSESGVTFGINITSQPSQVCNQQSCPPYDCVDGSYSHKWCAAMGGASCVGGTAVTPPAPYTEMKIYPGGFFGCPSFDYFSDITWNCPAGKVKGGGIAYNGGPQNSSSSYSGYGYKCF